MAQKKKRQTPRKTKAQITKSVKRQKESAATRISGEISNLMGDVEDITQALHDLLRSFKRLKPYVQEHIYKNMAKIAQSFDDVIDDYWEALPEELREDSEPDTDPAAMLFGIGILGLMMHLTRDRKPPENPEWPDAIDVEGGKIEPEPPKQLKEK